LEIGISWFTSPYTWVIAFCVFTVLELTTGGIFALLCGLGALATALALYSGIVSTAGFTVLTFLVSTVALTVALWKPLQQMMSGLKSDPSEQDIVPFVGDMGTVVDKPLTLNGGQIRLHGSRLTAVLAMDVGVESLDPGTSVIVRKVDEQQRFVCAPTTPNTSDEA
jgi:membrane protein implicated in regulation of membrane protease activity